ncbi:MAG: DUF4184 family protein [Clostridiales bacterium]|nr:DUF4184 family protein [Clostridiales bacterium]
MPFTPYHMGPGILVKSLLRGSFSLMVFGWTQVIMDTQPLVVMLTNRGTLHGFTHTYAAAVAIALFAAVSGKYLAQVALRLGPRPTRRALTVPWSVAFASAFIGSLSHVALDSLIYTDIRPFAPVSQANPSLGLIPSSAVYDLSMVAGLLGAVIFFAVTFLRSRHNQGVNPTTPCEVDSGRDRA